MNTPLFHRTRLAICGLVLVLGWLASVHAQVSGTGTIAGRVFEGATGRSLQGAIVRVPGTTLVDYTDADGRYSLAGAPAGSTTVEVEYVGLDPLRQSVMVNAGATAVLNADLKSDVHRMSAFEVAESAR